MLLADGLRTTLADAIDTAVGAAGAERFQNTAQTATYATCTLQNPAFGDAATGVITLAGTPSDTSATVGTATRCGFYTAATAGTLLFTLGIATSGAPDMTMSNNVLANGDQVDITSLTVTVPAGAVDVT